MAALDGVGRLELYLGGNAEHTLELGSKFLLQFIDGGRRIERGGEVLLAEFHLNLQSVEVVDTIDDKQIARSKLGHREYHALHLRWEDIDTTNDEHVIGTALNSAHADARASAATLSSHQRAEVARAVA